MKKSLVFLALSALFFSTQNMRAGEGADDDFDRLDGTGTSGKTVNVIEWEGNLEIHVYPAGSVKNLALKLDDKTKGKKVMVIGYTFKEHPTLELDRRAILGIPLEKGFKCYKDPSSGDEYDKFVISNNGLALKPYAFTEPKQLYPDGHPALAKKEEKKDERKPAADEAKAKDADEDGNIKSFDF